MKSRFTPTLLSYILIVLCTSCLKEPDCTQEIPYDSVLVKFYDKDEEEDELKSFKFDLVGALGSDSVLYNRKDSLNTFVLNLNPSADTVSYFFITGVNRDTLVLEYKRELQWLSAECGPNFSYKGLVIVESTFDSVRLIQSVIDLEINENIRIYN